MARTARKPTTRTTSAATDGALAPVRVVAGYLRVSTDMQVRSGLGLGDQRRQVEAMAAVHGWSEPLFFVDEGISGAKESADRAYLQRMLQAVKNGEIDVVIVNSLDRLSRKARVSLALLDELRAAHVRLISVKEGFDTETPSGRLMFGILAMMAEYERELIASRVSAALAEHDRRDGERGGGMPYGYARDRETKRILVNGEQARIIRRIFVLRTGGMTLRAIAETLNRRHTPAPRGGLWQHSSVQAVLANAPYYRGGLRGASALRWPVILKDGEGTGHGY